MTKQLDKAESAAAHRHGGAWYHKGGHGDHLTDEARKAHQKEAKYRKRARRRVDKLTVEKERTA